MNILCLINNCGILEKFSGFWVVQVLVSAFLAILFLQSGFDKVLDWQGNLSWLKGHFAKTPFKNMVPLLVGTLTLFELAAGVVSAIGVFEAAIFKTYCFAFAGSLLAAISMLMLFFGQRMAKDYAGAVSIATYFVLVIIDIYFLA